MSGYWVRFWAAFTDALEEVVPAVPAATSSSRASGRANEDVTCCEEENSTDPPETIDDLLGLLSRVFLSPERPGAEDNGRGQLLRKQRWRLQKQRAMQEVERLLHDLGV